MIPFIVFALPRSRTAWTAQYLTHGGTKVAHDLAPFCKSVDEFASAFSKLDGTVETGAIVGWRWFVKLFPEAKIAVIRRPVEEIKRSLSQFGVTAVAGELESRDAMLDDVSRLSDVQSFDFRDLYLPEYRKRMFEHCLQREWDAAWDAQWAPVNVQIDVRARLVHLARNQADLTALKNEVANRSAMIS